MTWHRIESKIALLELVSSGRLKKRQIQADAYTLLMDLPWTRQSNRRNEIVVDDARGDELQRLLNQVWPEWSSILAELKSAGLPVSEQGWKKLCDIHRMRDLILPPRLNRRTAMAQIASHSKAGETALHRETLSAVELMHDGIVRIRPSIGLQLERNAKRYDAIEIASVLGELVISERALTDKTLFTGRSPVAILLIENLGPFLDFPLLHDWLIVHIPGWNTRTARLLLDKFPSLPCVHFGDLDPNGFRIAQHLIQFRAGTCWFVPDFWREYISKSSLKAAWPADLDLSSAPSLVKDIADQGVWLEQEAILLDPRLAESVRKSIHN